MISSRQERINNAGRKEKRWSEVGGYGIILFFGLMAGDCTD